VSRTPQTSRRSLPKWQLGLAAAVLVVAGCGQPWSPGPTADKPEVHTSELAGGQPCPPELPIGDDPSGHGSGTNDVGTTPSGGTTYGCRDVRLTDNAHVTPPGAVGQQGTVGGALDGGPAILRALGVGRSN
jgi:hypothetical protein